MPALYVVNLGCAKNQVDLEYMLGQLLPRRFTLAARPEQADVLLVNTCAFIEAATAESCAVIRELAAAKRAHQRLLVSGCLPQRYGETLAADIPAVDRWVPLRDEARIFEIIAEWHPAAPALPVDGSRSRISPRHYAYLRIADGCNHACSFCTIPAIRGRMRSVPPDALLREAQQLADEGVIELNLIAQDTSGYGSDLSAGQRLAALLSRLCGINGIEWIRLQYLYPATLGADLLAVIAAEPKLCKYIDVPLQHIADTVLRSMRRPGRDATERLLAAIAATVPGVTLRTTLIVGYPLEGDAEFDQLAALVRSGRFQRLGVFEYSREQGTPAYGLGDPVAPEEKRRRRHELMALQQRVSLAHNQRMVGATVPVIVDEVDRRGRARGRTQGDAPDVDNAVQIARAAAHRPGAVIPVTITRAAAYDLHGTPALTRRS